MKLTSRQKKIARAAPPFGRITGADFRTLKRRKNAKKKKKKYHVTRRKKTRWSGKFEFRS